MARIAGINIQVHKHAAVALTAIYGIGRVTAEKICGNAGIASDAKIKNLTEKEMELLRTEIAKIRVEGDLRREVCNEY